MSIAIRRCDRCTANLFVMLAPLAGHPQTSPYDLGLSQTFGYDSDIFPLPDRTGIQQPGGGVAVIEPDSSGLISTTLLLAGLDQPIGRQRVYGNHETLALERRPRYEISAKLAADVNAIWYRRDSSDQGPLSGRSSYDATTTSCYAQVMLR